MEGYYIDIANFGSTPYTGPLRRRMAKGTFEPDSSDIIGYCYEGLSHGEFADIVLHSIPPGFCGRIPVVQSLPKTDNEKWNHLLLNVPTVASRRMEVVSVQGGPGSLAIVMRAAVGVFSVELHLRYWPWSHGFALGELHVGYTENSASSPVCSESIDLVVGDALVMTLSGMFDPRTVRLARGQILPIPVAIVWDPRAAQTAMALLSGTIAGISMRPYRDAPLSNVDPLEWSKQHFANARQRIINPLEESDLGVVKRSENSGDQEDQVFHGEMHHGARSCGTEIIRYWTALRQMMRPCHHTDHGNTVTVESHPQLILWAGLPHWHRGVSPDQLGLSILPDTDHTKGYWGPDLQHWLHSSVYEALMVLDSPGLRRIMEHARENFRLSWTLDPRYATTGIDSARSIGWAGIFADQLVRLGLANEAFRDHLADLVDRVWLPRLRLPAWDVRDDSTTSNYVGMPRGWMPYQQAVGAYGLYRISQITDQGIAMFAARDAAVTVLERAYSRNGDRWVEWDFVGYDDANVVPLVEGAGAHRAGAMATRWMPMAVATVLLTTERSGLPVFDKAVAIWKQIVDDAKHDKQAGGRWLPPEALRFAPESLGGDA